MSLALLPEEIAGAIDDLGIEALLDSGARMLGVFRSDYHEDDLPGGTRLDSERRTFVIATADIAAHGLHKGTALTIQGEQYTVRRFEPMMPGFSRIVLNGPGT